MRRLRRYIFKDKSRGDSILPLPSLPALTDQTHHSDHDSQQQSLVFRLPAELRERILIEAFGGRTIHVDFRFRPPLQNLGVSGASISHPPLNRLPAIPRPRGKRDRADAAYAWRWFNCICHRTAPPGSVEYYETAPCQDWCLEGDSCCCPFWPGTEPHKCRVGAIGFLLTCKRAYVNVESSQKIKIVSFRRNAYLKTIVPMMAQMFYTRQTLSTL